MKISELVEILENLETKLGDIQIYKSCGVEIKDFFSEDIEILSADKFEKYTKAEFIKNGHIRGYADWYVMRNFKTAPNDGENFIII